MRQRVTAQRADVMRVDVPGGERRRDGGRDRDADRAADLLARVDQTGRDTGFRLLDACERTDRHRDERERETDAAEDERRGKNPKILNVPREPWGKEQRTGGEGTFHP